MTATDSASNLTIAALATAFLLLASVSVPSASAQEPNGTANDPSGDAAGKDPLDITRGQLAPDGQALKLTIDLKALGAAEPSPAQQQTKIGWRAYLDVVNTTTPEKNRTIYYQAAVYLKNDQAAPVPGDLFTALGLEFVRCEDNSCAGPTPTTFTATMDAAANKISFNLPFGSFGTGAKRLDLAKNGRINSFWLSSLDAVQPYKANVNAEAVDWKVVDDVPPIGPILMPWEAAGGTAKPAPPGKGGNPTNSTKPTNGTTASTSATITNASATPSNSTTASAGKPLGGDKEAKGVPGAGLLLTLGAVAPMAGWLRSRTAKGRSRGKR